MKFRSIKEITNGKISEFSSFNDIYDFFQGNELSSDFIIISRDYILKYNQLLNKSLADFKIFATTGHGDFWLICEKNNQIYFYDHDIEELSLENILCIDIDIYTWVRLADLFKQKEVLEESNSLSNYDDVVFSEIINELSPKLLGILF